MEKLIKNSGYKNTQILLKTSQYVVNMTKVMDDLMFFMNFGIMRLGRSPVRNGRECTSMVADGKVCLYGEIRASFSPQSAANRVAMCKKISNFAA
ncbi:MAG: hypothetical protein J5980_08095 [Muribaculaceae bacterium]|nr:hypothetical protein [Muribaculaceae bacterium]